MTDARLENALKHALESQNLSEAVRLALELGDQLTTAGQYPKALDNFTLATRLCQELGDMPRLVEALYKLSDAYLQLEEPEKAIIRVKRALELAHQSQNATYKGKLWALLGDSHLAVDKADEAHVDFEQATKYLMETGDSVGAGIALSKRAAIFLDMDKPTEATVALAQSASYFEEAKRVDLQMRALGNLGTAFGRLGRWHEAGKRHMLALKLAKEIHDQEEERFQLTNLGFVAEQDGHIEWAITYYRQALYLAILNDERRAIGQLSLDLGRLLLGDDKTVPQAIVMLKAAIGTVQSSELREFVKEAKSRYTYLGSINAPMLAPVEDIKLYAQQAYQV